jgi:elongation factor G
MVMMHSNNNILNIRNIGIIAHIDAGKTTTTERILYYTRKVYKMGEVDEGSATMDYMREEKERGITITSAATTCYWKGIRVNLIDTPGHVDFTAEVERSLRILDGAIMLFSAVEGVESQSEAVWRQADRYNVPRIVYVNKLDRVGADPFTAVRMMEERLHVKPVMLQVPVGEEDSFKGIIDLIKLKSLTWSISTDGSEYDERDIPKELESKALKWRDKLIETLSDYDDNLAEQYISGGHIKETEIKKVIRQGVISEDLFPVLFGASLKNTGVQPLLDAVKDYLPSPVDRPPIEGQKLGSTEKEVRVPSDDEPLSALVFKVQNTPFGNLCYLRIYSGMFKVGTVVFNSTIHKRERISRIFLMHADKREVRDKAHTGEIVAVLGPKETKTGHTFSSSQDSIVLEIPKFPEPVISITIEPKRKTDGERLGEVLRRLCDEDPTLDFKFDAETGQTIMRGMGELHLDVTKTRMERNFSVAVRVGNPRVAYKETITKSAIERGKFIRQTGGRGQYGDVIIEVRPLPRGGEFKFEDTVKEGEIPKQYIPAIKEGILESMEVGPLAGFPVVDVHVILIGGSYHPVDSSEPSFKTASSIAFKNAVQKGDPILLEPVMNLEIIVPGEYVGAVLEDMRARGGKVTSMKSDKATHTIMASCPLRELFGYATTIRSLTQGRAVYTTEFDSYRELPEDIYVSLLEKIRGY